MLKIRKSRERGHFDHGWLDTHHTFSFAGYRDPEHMGYRSLRVINEDTVAPGMGFGMHGHADMEIVTCVLRGALQHKDSLGNGSILVPGEMQRMTAGTGIEHSEFNPSEKEPVHLYQIWLRPATRGLTPSYEQKAFSPASRLNALCLVASPDAEGNSMRINQDAYVYLATLDKEIALSHPLKAGRGAWLQVLSGNLTADGKHLTTGDGAAVDEVRKLELKAIDRSEILLFDLA